MLEIRGIGNLTEQYVAMRAMSCPVPETDAGIQKALQSYESKELKQMAEVWRSWGIYVTINLWNTL